MSERLLMKIQDLEILKDLKVFRKKGGSCWVEVKGVWNGKDGKFYYGVNERVYENVEELGKIWEIGKMYFEDKIEKLWDDREEFYYDDGGRESDLSIDYDCCCLRFLKMWRDNKKDKDLRKLMKMVKEDIVSVKVRYKDEYKERFGG